MPDNQRLILETARLLKDSFLQQNAFDDIDTYAVPKKQFLMLKIIMHFYSKAKEIIKGHLPIYKLLELPVLNDIRRMKENISNDETGPFENLFDQIDKQINQLERECMVIL